ncbi:MAG: hypothetical protein QXL15_03010 [Candidatus Korarchaeota archaeon]
MTAKMSIKMVQIIIIASILVFSFPVKVSALGNGGFTSDPNEPKYGTLDWMGYHAISLIKESMPSYVVWIDMRMRYFYLGTEAPDNPYLHIGRFAGWNDTASQFNRYDLTGGVVTINEDYQNCSSLLQTHYSYLVQALKNRDYDRAAWEAGVVTHYIGVLSGWGHVLTTWNGTDFVRDDARYSNYAAQLDEVLLYPSQQFPGDFPALAFNKTKVIARVAATQLGAYTFYDDQNVSAEYIKALFNSLNPPSYSEWDELLKNATKRRLAKGIETIAHVIYSAIMDSGYVPEAQPTFVNVVLVFGFGVITAITIGIAIAIYFGTKKRIAEEAGGIQTQQQVSKPEPESQ